MKSHLVVRFPALACALIVFASFASSQTGSLPVRIKSIDKKSKQLSVECKVPVFAGSSALAKLANKTLEAAVREDLAIVQKQAKEDWANTKEWTPPAPYYLGISPNISVSTPRLISMHFSCESFTGGAHGSLWLPCYNFGVVNGKVKRLKLQDLFLKNRDGVDITSRLVIADLREKDASWVKEGTITELSDHQANNFVVTKKGLQFLFEPYSAGSWAEGVYMVDVPFSSLAGHLDPNGPLKGILSRAK